MRLEVIIPDDAPAELKAKVSNLVRRLNEEPEIAETFSLGSGGEAELIFTPERPALIDAAEADANMGKVYTSQQVRDFLHEKHDAWLLAHPH